MTWLIVCYAVVCNCMALSLSSRASLMASPLKECHYWRDPAWFTSFQVSVVSFVHGAFGKGVGGSSHHTPSWIPNLLAAKPSGVSGLLGKEPVSSPTLRELPLPAGTGTRLKTAASTPCLLFHSGRTVGLISGLAVHACPVIEQEVS